MGFETPMTIRAVMKELLEGRWVVPGFQRGVVWGPDKIELLFDSLMSGYPIGSLLLWKLERPTAASYPFFEFVRDFHGRIRRSGERAALQGRDDVRAVLDGQQRLTSLLIGLTGSYADRIRYGRQANPNAWPKRHLYLNVLATPPSGGEGPDHRSHSFRLLTEQQAKNGPHAHWFPMTRLLNMPEPGDVADYLRESGLDGSRTAERAVHRLRNLIWDEPKIGYYLEGEQDFHMVVVVFQRLNKAGTPLTSGEIVFSTAVEQWSGDARGKIDALVSELNAHGQPDHFRFDRSFVLKACLVLADISSVRFEVGNYGAKNMAIIEKKWPGIAEALRLTTRFLQQLGYGDRTLTSKNAILPIAYYLATRDSPHDFLTHHRWETDRENIRKWLASALLLQIFSGHSDAKLTAARRAMAPGVHEFPARDVLESLAVKPPTPDDIDAVLTSKYPSGRAFAALSLLYPGFRFDELFDLDHLQPRSLASPSRLAAMGLNESDAEFYREHVDELPNLQILTRNENQSKLAKPLDEHLRSWCPTRAARNAYLDRHLISRNIALHPRSFRELFLERRRRMAEALTDLLS